MRTEPSMGAVRDPVPCPSPSPPVTEPGRWESAPVAVSLVIVACGAALAGAAVAGLLGAYPAASAPRDAAITLGVTVFGLALSLFASRTVHRRHRRGVVALEALAERARDLDARSRALADDLNVRTVELRKLARHTEHLREDERRVLAREVHDELGQLLTALRMELDIAERVRARGGDVQAEHEKLGQFVDATLASTRSLLSHLRPRILDDFGLVAALSWLASDTRRRAGIVVHFSAEPEDIEVSAEVASGLFRIVQESLTNVLRHAQARRVKVGLALGAGALVATVADDGVGLPPEKARRSTSMGLLGMRERAQALGGTFELSPSPEGGVLVTVQLPATLALVPLRESA